jgi:hypothetical protein
MVSGVWHKSSSMKSRLPTSRTTNACEVADRNVMTACLTCGSGPDRNRTDDLIHAMDALYQLSYGPGTNDANKREPSMNVDVRLST